MPQEECLHGRFGVLLEELLLESEHLVIDRPLASRQDFTLWGQPGHGTLALAPRNDQARDQSAVGDVNGYLGMITPGVVVPRGKLALEVGVEEIEAVVDDTQNNLGIPPGHLPRVLNVKFLKQRLLARISSRFGRGGIRRVEAPGE